MANKLVTWPGLSEGWGRRILQEELLKDETQVPSHQSGTFVFIIFLLFILVFLLQGKKGSWETGLRLIFPWLSPSSQLFLACLLLFLPLLLLFLLHWVRHWDVQWGLQIAQVGFIESWLLTQGRRRPGGKGIPLTSSLSWSSDSPPWPLLSSSLPSPSTFKNASNSEIFLGK